MVAISVSFLAGRYHATPWDRHVNEGAVEWPPSPWRILRALVATWKRTLPDLPLELVEPVLRAVAQPPEFSLPPASTGHTRHFMPWYKKGPTDRTLVFDTFVALSRDDILVARWPNVELDDAQRATLDRILENLTTLGRAESWCEAKLLSDAEGARYFTGGVERQRHVSTPVSGRAVPSDAEVIRLLCSDPTSAFTSDLPGEGAGENEGRGRSRTTRKHQSPVYDPAWNLCRETLQLHEERWSDPPGACWVRYARPRTCFGVQPGARLRLGSAPKPRIQVARYALDSTLLPLVTETLPVGEAARRVIMGIHGRLTERAGSRGRSGIFSGKDVSGHPLTGNGHAYYLPTDEDGDGRIDHLTIFAREGFGPSELRTLDRFRVLNLGRRDKDFYPLRLLLLGLGTLSEYAPGFLQKSRIWVSGTPYIAARHAKTRGRHRVATPSASARAEFLMADLRAQLAAVRPDLTEDEAGPIAIVSESDESGTFRIRRSESDPHGLRPIEFKRFRSKPGDDGGRRLAGSFRMEFSQEVGGPIVLGHSSHFGMGLFRPVIGEARTWPTLRETTVKPRSRERGDARFAIPSRGVI